MRVLFDIIHPAHVHFYRCLRDQLEDEGHQTLVVGRDREVAVALLREYEIPFEAVGRGGRTSRIVQGAELLRRDWVLWRLGRRFGADVVLTRNPAGVHAARLLGKPGIFDTCDGKAAGILFYAAAPFASVITSPSSMMESYGAKHRPYPGYNALAFLHPSRFTPDPTVRDELAVGNDPIFVLRLVANTSVHDASSTGIDDGMLGELLEQLAPLGHVLISSERPLPSELRSFEFGLAPSRLHHVLAEASLYIGDSGAMAAEAALLGVPTIRFSSWAGPDHYLEELDVEYGLVKRYSPGNGDAFFDAVRTVTSDLEGSKQRSMESRRRVLADKVDVTSWYRDLLDEVVAGSKAR